MNMKAEKREREKKENCDFFFEAASVALGATILVGRRGLLHLEGVDEG